MRHQKPHDRRCSYLVVIDDRQSRPEPLRELATYLSTLSVADCDVVVVDVSPADVFARNDRVLRWVARHVAPQPRHRVDGAVDSVRAAVDLAACEKVIVAAAEVRYDELEIDQLCTLLDMHEVVEPQDYLDPLPWWGGIDAGRMLVHRGVEPLPDHGTTFGFRRSALRGLRGIDVQAMVCDDQVRRLAAQGAEVHSASDVFVRRTPPPLALWIDERLRQATDDFEVPVKTAFFFALLPMAILLAAFGGLRMAGGYAGAIACGSLLLALRGRMGAGAFFPLRACLFAPLWVFERSVSVYAALYRKLRGGELAPTGLPIAERGHGDQVASGE